MGIWHNIVATFTMCVIGAPLFAQTQSDVGMQNQNRNQSQYQNQNQAYQQRSGPDVRRRSRTGARDNQRMSYFEYYSPAYEFAEEYGQTRTYTPPTYSYPPAYDDDGAFRGLETERISPGYDYFEGGYYGPIHPYTPTDEEVAADGSGPYGGLADQDEYEGPQFGYTTDVDYDPDYGAANIDFNFNEQVRGRVIGLERIRGTYGAPDSVRLRVRTEDGQTRTVMLGDVTYVQQNLPYLQQGEQVVVGGKRIQVDNQPMFKAQEIRSQAGSYLIPDYEYSRRIEGELVGLRQVRTLDGNVASIVAQVRTPDRGVIDVLLGSREDLRGRERIIQPGARVNVEGYERITDTDSTFVVRDVTVLARPNQQAQPSQGRQVQQQDQRR